MSDAPDELRVYAAYLRRIAFEAVATLQDLSAGQLNWKTGEDGSNTMFAIATHMVAMGEYWVLCLVGGADIALGKLSFMRLAAQRKLFCVCRLGPRPAMCCARDLGVKYSRNSFGSSMVLVLASRNALAFANMPD